MTVSCQQCGAELLPQTSFCRQCGTPISSSAHTASESTTRLLDESDAVTTQRLDPRPTSPGRGPLNSPNALPVAPARRGRNKLGLLSLVVLVLLAGIVSTVAIRRNRHDRGTVVVDSLTYPGARKLVDIVSEGGGHAVHLETTDSFDNVQDWYRRKLEPEKVMQLTTFSVVMKNEKTTATIVREGDKTNVLLKIVP
jgi:zinc-ribbon domain